MFGNFFAKIKGQSEKIREINALQKKIKEKYKKTFGNAEEIEINKENEKEILEKIGNFIKECLKEVDNLTILTYEQKQIAKQEIVKVLVKKFKKNIDYFKNKKPKEIKKMLGLQKI